MKKKQPPPEPPPSLPKPPPPKPEIAKKSPAIKKRPLPSRVRRIAIIIDDVGYPSEQFDEYLSFEGNLSFSVLPFLNGSSHAAELLKERGFEILLHIPMEPLDYPNTDPGPYALLSDDSGAEVQEKLTRMIESVPYAAGANNHMGSKATQDCELVDSMLSVLRKHDMYFIDSVTSGRSCAYEHALELGLKASKRDIFLDNVDSFSYINSQFEKLKKKARSRGTAVGIGHINKKNTIKVLKYQLPLLKEERFELIFASKAAHQS